MVERIDMQVERIYVMRSFYRVYKKALQVEFNAEYIHICTSLKKDYLTILIAKNPKLEVPRAVLQSFSIRRIRQIDLCGCGLAALEMVLRYYGTDVSQLDFLKSDK